MHFLVRNQMLTRIWLVIVLCILLMLMPNVWAQAQTSSSNADTSNKSQINAKQSNTTSSSSLNNPDVQANLQAMLSANPALAAQVQQTLAGTDATQANAQNAPPQGNTGGLANGANTAGGTPDNANPAATGTDGTNAQNGYVSNPWQAQDANTAAMRSQSFQNVANQAFPLTPQQIQTLNNMLDDTQRAQAAAAYNAPPMPTSTSLLVNLDPGATPPVIRLSKGFVSSLVFIDSTGAPWPIEAYDLGNPGAFNIKWDAKSNTLMVQAMATYTYGNLAVKLQNLNTPVMLTLVPGQKQIDYRVDLRIQGMGPYAKASIGGSGLPGQADQELLNILDGIAPPNAKQLVVDGGLADAWVLKNDLYVRTRFDLISPGWISKMSSADGTNAYKLQPTPLLLISRYGKVVSLKVEGL